MENSAGVDAVCQSSESELNTAVDTMSLIEATQSELDSSESRTSPRNTKDVENAAIASIHQSLENEVAANKQSATAPGKPQAREIGSSSIVLEWKKPLDRDVSYYEIRFKTKTETEWRRPVFSDFDKPCHQMRSLEQDTEYEFTVRAHYQDKEGDFSEKSDAFKTKSLVVATTSSTALHPRRKPGKPKALNVKDDHIQLGWDKPEDKDVHYYEIKYKSSNDAHWSKPVLTENANTFYRVNGLLPDRDYKFKVKSYYQTFEGMFSDVGDAVKTHKAEQVNLIHYTTSSSRPGKPAALDVGCDYACISWDKPDQCDVEYYELKMKTTTDESWFKIPSFTEDNTPYKTVADLAHGTEYEFKVRGHYEEDEGEFSEKSDPILTKQPSTFTIDLGRTSTSRKVPLRKPGKPCRLAAGCDYVDVGWDRPADKGVIYYELKSKTANTETWNKMPAFTDDAKAFCRVSGLSPSTQYAFKVRAHFQEEEGEFSDVSDNIATSDMLEHMDVENNSMSVVKFQEGFNPNHEVNFSRPSTDLTWYRTPTHTEVAGYCPENIRLEQEHGWVIEPKVLSIRNDDYLSRGRYPDTVHTSGGSTTKRLTAQYMVQGSDSKHTHSRQPGKPTYSDLGSDFIHLHWLSPECEDVVYYEIKYRLIRDEMWGKDSVTTNNNSPQISVRGLLQDNEYKFKVRAYYRDGEGEFSEQSDTIRTTQSAALAVRNVCVKLQDGEPAFYKLPLTEHKASRNTKYKTRKCEFGSSLLLQEKTIMMIGATGSGKSTLIDGMVNHIMGVKWEDDFRFKIIDLMTEEEARKGLETESQTDWITSYRVHPTNRTVPFICNIIDTPGFGDTRGIERDHQLVDQIRAFFDTKGVQGIETIDAICFVTQAPLARLTHTQRYIYDSILSIFGKDMKDNIVAMITFADGKDPPVLNALQQAEIPTAMHFIFNNSALFEPNTDAKCKRFGKMFWEMGFFSYAGFFNFLPHMKTQSLQLTAKVLLKRDQLNATVEGLLPQIDMGLVELATMRTERDLMDKYERQIADNQDFTYKVDEFRQRKVSLDPGEYVTNCTFCHFSCHYPCMIADDNQKSHCAAMTNGVCTVCPANCAWESHRNNDYRIDVSKVEVQRTFEQMKKKLQIAKEEKVSKANLLHRLGNKFKAVKDNVCQMMGSVRDCGNYLRKNAIKANPLTELEYIDILIQSAEQQKKPGFIARVKMLNILKRGAEVKAKSVKMTPEEYMKEMGFL